MAVSDWSSDEKSLFSHSVEDMWSELDAPEKTYATVLFEIGFLDPNISTSTRIVSREAWYDLIGLDPRDFDWSEWKRIMGYSDQ